MLKRTKVIPLFKFLQILQMEVWISFAVAFFVTAIMCYCFEHFSPYSYKNNRDKYKDETDERFCNLKECFWFTATAITPQGSGDTPKNLSGKLAAATWWLFGFVIVAAYTANLAAQQTLARLETHIETFDQLIRQRQTEYSVVRNSDTYKYFNDMMLAETVFYEMWRSMSLNESKSDQERRELTVWDYPLEETYTKIFYSMKDTGFIPNTEIALRKIRKIDGNRDFALISETMTIKYLLLTNCDLRQVGDDFAKRPYAIAVQKGSPLKKPINDALLRLMTEGKLDQLKKKWWDDNPANKHCSPEREVNAGFGMDYMLAVFILIGIGTAVSALILSVEYWWYCYRLKTRVEKLNTKDEFAKRND